MIAMSISMTVSLACDVVDTASADASAVRLLLWPSGVWRDSVAWVSTLAKSTYTLIDAS